MITNHCAEQITDDLDYHQFPVANVAVGCGLAYGALGYSHHTVQDYALMRSMSNMLLAAPGDPMEVRACMRYLIQHPQPSYLRLAKAGEPCFHEAPPKLTPGEWLQVAPDVRGEGRCLLTTGATLDLAMRWTGEEAEWRGCAVYTLPLWGMGCKQAQPEQLARWEQVVTLEDHLTDGGFGSWLLESTLPRPELAQRLTVKALAPEVCGMVGKQATLNAAGGLRP